MSGLAYSDSFTVDSYFNGTHYSYVITKDSGIPTSIKVFEGTTSEPNGVKLSLPVEVKDIPTFEKTASEVYLYFDDKPITNIPIPMTLSTSISCDDWFFLESSTYSTHVLMGNVLYAIPRNSEIKNHQCTDMVIRCPIGSVGITPGRESLSLDKETIKYLNSRMDSIREDLPIILQSIINEKPTPFQKLQAIYKCNSLVDYKVLSTCIPSELTNQVNIGSYTSYVSSNINNLMLGIRRNHYKKVSYGSINLRDFLTAKFLIIDVKTRFNDAINSISSNIVVIKNNGGIPLDTFITEAIQWCDTIGIEYQRASDLVDTTPRESTAVVRTASIYGSDCFPTINKSKELDLTKEYWYLPASNTTIDIDPDQYSAFRLLYTRLPIELRKQLVAIPKKYLSAVEAHPNFHLATDAILEALDSYIFITKGKDVTYDGLYVKKIANPPSFLQSVIAVQNKVYNHTNLLSYEEYTLVKNHFDIKVFTISYEVPIKEIYSTMPLLHHLLTNYSVTEHQLNHYIDLELTYGTISEVIQQYSYHNLA